MPSRLDFGTDEVVSSSGAGPGAATGTFPPLTEGESVPTWNVTASGVGVDRLSFSFPVSDWQDLGRWDSVRTDRAGEFTAQVQVGEPNTPLVMVGLTTIEGQPWGKVECNPSRFVDPKGCGLLPPRDLPGALSVMWAAAGEMTRPSCRLGDARLRRVDVARDFRGVTSPALYVEGLQPLKRPYARKSATFNDPARGSAQTLYVGSKAGTVRLYDQHAAYADKGAPEGSLRFEIEAHKGWLQSAGARYVSELDAVVVGKLARERWEWSQMGTTVSGPVNAVQVLQRQVQAGELKQATADRLLGVMVRQSFGFGQQTKTSEWRHRQVMHGLGLTAGALWNDDLSRQASGRLDFETGTEFLELTS